MRQASNTAQSRMRKGSATRANSTAAAPVPGPREGGEPGPNPARRRIRVTAPSPGDPEFADLRPDRLEGGGEIRGIRDVEEHAGIRGAGLEQVARPVRDLHPHGEIWMPAAFMFGAQGREAPVEGAGARGRIRRDRPDPVGPDVARAGIVRAVVRAGVRDLFWPSVISTTNLRTVWSLYSAPFTRGPEGESACQPQTRPSGMLVSPLTVMALIAPVSVACEVVSGVIGWSSQPALGP